MDARIVWDLEDDADGNVQHLREHDVTIEEAEEVLLEEEMKAQRIFRANDKTPEERVVERRLREQLQKERPSLEDLVRTCACDADGVMTMGMYFDVQSALQGLKRERKRCGLSIGDVAKRSGLDRAVVSRLENGKQDNPTVATLMRYAAAVGKRFLWCYEDLSDPTNGDGEKSRRRTARQAPERRERRD